MSNQQRRHPGSLLIRALVSLTAGTHVAVPFCVPHEVRAPETRVTSHGVGAGQDVKAFVTPPRPRRRTSETRDRVMAERCTPHVALSPSGFLFFSPPSSLYSSYKRLPYYRNLKADDERAPLPLSPRTPRQTGRQTPDTHSSSYFTFQLSFDPQSCVHCNYASFCSLLAA